MNIKKPETLRTITLFHQVYDVNDTAAVKSCAESLTVADLWSLSYGARPEEWTPKEKKQKKRNPTKYKFLSAAQMQFLADKPLRKKRNAKKAAMMQAHLKTKIWLAQEVTLPDVKNFQQQQKDFEEDNRKYTTNAFVTFSVTCLRYLSYSSTSACKRVIFQ